MSYAHKNDIRDNGKLSRFRQNLEDEIGVQTGDSFQVLQDRTHLEPGFRWDESIWELLDRATLFIPVLTPDYYASDWCRREFEHFYQKKPAISRRPLIYPLYYIPCEQIPNRTRYDRESMEFKLGGYTYADWRKLRHRSLRERLVQQRLTNMAERIRGIFARLESMSSKSLANEDILDPPDSPVRSLDMADAVGFGPPFDTRMLPRAPKFFGRSTELAGVLECLTRTRGSRIVYIEGAPGIGKTVLAAEAIHDLYMDKSFPDGIAVALCAQTRDPLAILRHILTRFDAQRRAPIQVTEEELLAEASRLLDAKDALIVLDDLLITRAAVHVINALHASGASLLITSTSVPTLAHGKRFNLPELPRDAAISLLKPTLRGDPNESSGS